ncbi:MAG: RNA-binding cell elongation regulator Jag/EloR [Dehalococcoidia bacterium]|nr:RNA-binding cell elongation regulator Jag/EloR [Dehalococcoidia bacterium]
MESVEVSAKTVDEAIDIALDELGLKRNQANIEILTPGKPGIFGLGGEQARVRVTALEEGTARPAAVEEESEDVPEGAVEVKDIHAEEVDLAVDYLRTLLELAGAEAEVSVRAPETAADGLGRATAVLDIEGEDLGLLIGRRGVTLSALQYLINVMVTRKLGSRVLVTVDVEHYHRRREDTLHGLAQRMADRVRNSRRPITLEPMPAAERRIIHLALVDDPYVMTGSVGVGDERKVVIRPRGDSQGGQRPQRPDFDGRGRPPGV